MSESQRPTAPEEVERIVGKLRELLSRQDDQGRRVGSAKFGVYAFYDYDGEPIYVGQTRESLSSRIGRHMTGGRSDPVAKFVLDPFEVAEVALYPLWELQGRATGDAEAKATVDAAEYTLYQRCIEESMFAAVLNEDAIKRTQRIALPTPIRGQIIPDDVHDRRKHPDIRIARRASTIASLARIVSERKLREPSGLRKTLDVQAQRLAHLCAQRHLDIRTAYPGKPLQVEPVGDDGDADGPEPSA